jgi:hypothetical protein
MRGSESLQGVIIFVKEELLVDVVVISFSLYGFSASANFP